MVLSLNQVESTLVSLRIPFMQIRWLKIQRQLQLKGSVLNVPADLDHLCPILPHAPMGLHTVLVNVKRILKGTSRLQC